MSEVRVGLGSGPRRFLDSGLLLPLVLTAITTVSESGSRHNLFFSFSFERFTSRFKWSGVYVGAGFEGTGGLFGTENLVR